MGFRFRKSISLFPGVRLNFGKTGMSVSAGVPGFRKTISTSGRVTTSVGIPGTGLYYVDTKYTDTKALNKNQLIKTTLSKEDSNFVDYESHDYSTAVYEQANVTVPITQVTFDNIKFIHKTSDDTIDWTEILVNPYPPDESYNIEMWNFYHSIAGEVLDGNIDTYLRLIYEINPLDDLLAYGSGFEFGTDDPRKMEVEYTANEEALVYARSTVSGLKYNSLLEDYICSSSIRIARDIFALLPVRNTIVQTVLNGDIILSVDYDRNTMSKIKFGFIDPSDTIKKFNNRTKFDLITGFSVVEPIV